VFRAYFAWSDVALVRMGSGSTFALPLAFALVACDEGDAHFTTKFASDFTPARHTVSVLGVYKDGQMSSDGWTALAPHLAPALGEAACESGYEMLTSANGPLAETINEYARADGPTEELLAQVAPAAKGDAVLVLTFAGKLPQRVSADAGVLGSASAPAVTRGGGRMGGMRGGGRVRRSSRSEIAEDANVLDVSASLFSIAAARSVALVAMQYSGTSLEEAMTKFAAKLGQSLPNMTCAGWNWNANIDGERIRKSIDR
jgi:hypothetical protein